MRPVSVLALLVLTLAGCGERKTVPADRVEGAIRSLPYEVRFRDVAQPRGGDVVAGRLRDPRTGTAIDFAVFVGQQWDDRPIVPGSGRTGWTGCAGASIEYTQTGPNKAERERAWGMDAALEQTIFDLAPGAYCEG
jgi:hypothetical protein